MNQLSSIRTRTLRIIAQDPALRIGGKLLTAEVQVPAEALAPGPWGYRVHVIDYDSSARALYKPPKYEGDHSAFEDPFAKASDSELLEDPRFHAQNVYAIVMRTLARFEQALGRRVSWGFKNHQLKVAPHAFADANAFYSERDQALLFGYFTGRRGTVFSCLSHDVVAHETTHALLDGLRERYTDPSSPDQAGFHEGFSDLVALLSTFSLKPVVRAALELSPSRANRSSRSKASRAVVPMSRLTVKALRHSILFGLAEQMGEEMAQVRGQPLRRSIELEPSVKYIKDPEFEEPHRRGEILVAAMMNAFLLVWQERLKTLGQVTAGHLDLERVIEEGAEAADYLLTMSIRALDYCPPVHLEYCDFLTALLTADFEVHPDDSRYQFRKHLRESFMSYGMPPSSKVRVGQEVGLWAAPHQPKGLGADDARGDVEPSLDGVHFDSLVRDPDEVFRFIWDNRGALDLYPQAFSRVLSVRPCLRIGPDGFALRETVAEFMQILTLHASELHRLRIKVPDGMPAQTEVRLFGGGTLIFDEFGQLKYNIHNRIHNARRQSLRLEYLWRYGYFSEGAAARQRFSHIHRVRARDQVSRPEEVWS